jgi:hypothetical protein
MSNSKFFNKTVIVTKEVDEAFDNNHPKGVNEGDRFEGRLTQFSVGYPVYVEINDSRSFRSSTVKLIDEESGIFQTLNSIYKIELHSNQIDYDALDEVELKQEMTLDVRDMPAEAGQDMAMEAPHYGDGRNEAEVEAPREDVRRVYREGVGNAEALTPTPRIFAGNVEHAQERAVNENEANGNGAGA